MDVNEFVLNIVVKVKYLVSQNHPLHPKEPFPLFVPPNRIYDVMNSQKQGHCTRQIYSLTISNKKQSLQLK